MNKILFAVRGRCVWVILLASLTTPMLKAQGMAVAATDDQGQTYSLYRMDGLGPVGSRTEPLSSCGDALSVALQQGTPEFPCWANIRTVDRWNSASIGFGISPYGARGTVSPSEVPSSFTFTAGGLNAFSLPGDGEGRRMADWRRCLACWSGADGN
jgi:hypothetical protein